MPKPITTEESKLERAARPVPPIPRVVAGLFPSALLCMLLLAAAGALGAVEPAFVHELSVVPGEGGQSNFGRPYLAVASPDGRNLYVVTFPAEVPSALLSFERVGQSLELRDSWTDVEGGLSFAATGLDITDDGAYVLLASFSAPAGVHVFARDAQSGLLSHTQFLSHPDLDVVDGVDAAYGAVMWGRPAVPETGGALARLERMNGQGLAEIGHRQGLEAQTDNPWQASPASRSLGMPIQALTYTTSDDNGEANYDASAVYEGLALTILADNFNTECVIQAGEIETLTGRSLEDLSGLTMDHAGTDQFLIGLVFSDFSRVILRVDPSLCTFTLEETTGPLFGGILGPSDVTTERGIDSEGNVTIYHYLFGVENNHDDLDRSVAAFGENLELDENGFVVRSETPYIEAIPFTVGPANDVTSTDLLAGDAGEASILAYVTTVSPPGIHAYRLTTDAVAGTACLPGDTRACPGGFSVEVDWEDHQGNTGQGHVVPGGSADSELFWFFRPNNWEMLIKLLDGCAVNGHFWVFYAATTDVGFDVSVSHPELGSRSYSNPLGVLAPAVTDTSAFACSPAQIQAARQREDDSDSVAAQLGAFAQEAARTLERAGLPQSACTDSDTVLCLTPDRFQVEVDWRKPNGETGVGHVVPLRSTDSGLFWFFRPDNWEMLIKVLDGCAVNGHHWLLLAATTDVEYTVRVTDTLTQEVAEVFNPLGSPSAAVADVEALAGCN